MRAGSKFRFPVELVVTPVDNNVGYFMLKKPFRYISESGITYTAPEGFLTNFGSIPKAIQGYFPPYGKYGKATVIHDFLYSVDCDRFISRKQADFIFLEAMKHLGVSIWKRTLMYSAVRMFGGSHFQKL